MLACDPGTTGRKPTNDDQLLPARIVWTRYSVTSRTLDRWVADPRLGFPRPILINRRRYFSADAIAAWERSRAAAKTA